MYLHSGREEGWLFHLAGINTCADWAVIIAQVLNSNLWLHPFKAVVEGITFRRQITKSNAVLQIFDTPGFSPMEMQFTWMYSLFLPPLIILLEILGAIPRPTLWCKQPSSSLSFNQILNSGYACTITLMHIWSTFFYLNDSGHSSLLNVAGRGKSMRGKLQCPELFERQNEFRMYFAVVVCAPPKGITDQNSSKLKLCCSMFLRAPPHGEHTGLWAKLFFGSPSIQVIMACMQYENSQAVIVSVTGKMKILVSCLVWGI